MSCPWCPCCYGNKKNSATTEIYQAAVQHTYLTSLGSIHTHMRGQNLGHWLIHVHLNYTFFKKCFHPTKSIYSSAKDKSIVCKVITDWFFRYNKCYELIKSHNFVSLILNFLSVLFQWVQLLIGWSIITSFICKIKF